ncbi:MAG TPA: hypothetical protein ENO18_00585 [Caldithrix sp.]|nr:hypothetical protein [Caldithrix sp.]
MGKKQFIILVAASFIGGMFGGIISNKIFISDYALAKNASQTQVIKAKEFQVVDDNGKKLGSFGAENYGALLSISRKDKNNVENLVKLHFAGLEVSQILPGNRKYGKSETKIEPFGFSYKEYSQYEMEQAKNNPLSDLFDQRVNISIGENQNSDERGGAINLYDARYKLRLTIGGIKLHQIKTDSTIHRPQSSIVMFNEQGGIIWEAP